MPTHKLNRLAAFTQPRSKNLVTPRAANIKHTTSKSSREWRQALRIPGTLIRQQWIQEMETEIEATRNAILTGNTREMDAASKQYWMNKFFFDPNSPDTMPHHPDKIPTTRQERRKRREALNHVSYGLLRFVVPTAYKAYVIGDFLKYKHPYKGFPAVFRDLQPHIDAFPAIIAMMLFQLDVVPVISSSLSLWVHHFLKQGIPLTEMKSKIALQMERNKTLARARDFVFYYFWVRIGEASGWESIVNVSRAFPIVCCERDVNWHFSRKSVADQIEFELWKYSEFGGGYGIYAGGGGVLEAHPRVVLERNWFCLLGVDVQKTSVVDLAKWICHCDTGQTWTSFCYMIATLSKNGTSDGIQNVFDSNSLIPVGGETVYSEVSFPGQSRSCFQKVVEEIVLGSHEQFVIIGGMFYRKL
ncbi:hypothetical protein BDR26DRAFT_1011622 [Obelidium mucronatum]|nr:hypothetical protein BDR26DRAFT_1011622 [Obelidium mucronatum]